MDGRRPEGPLEVAVHLHFRDRDPYGDPARVLRAVAAFQDERSWGQPDLDHTQISRRSRVDVERIPDVLADLVKADLLHISSAPRRPTARRFHVRLTPITPDPKGPNA